MTDHTKELLQALRQSYNATTAHCAKGIVTGQHFGRRESSLTMEEAASKGILGGFLKAVMVGSDQEIWQLADELNQQAIAHLIPRHIKNGVDERFVDGSDLT